MSDKEAPIDSVTSRKRNFHQICFEEWLKINQNVCPCCKQSVGADPVVNEDQIENLDKEALLSLLKSKTTDFPVEKALNRFLNLISDADASKKSEINALLHVAVENSNEELVKALLKNGADVNDSNEDEEIPTPLHTACGNFNLLIVKLLLESDADSNKRDHFDCPPFFYALNSKDQDAKILKYLLENKLCDLESVDFLKRNCLYYAVENGTREMFDLLIKAGADPKMESSEGNLVNVAVSANKIDIVRILLKEYKISADRLDENEMTPLIIAIKNGSLELVKLLLSNGAKVARKDGDGATPIAHAVTSNNIEIAECLLKKSKKNINDFSFMENPPLLLALERKYFKMAEILIKYGAKINVKSCEDLNIIEFLCDRNIFKEGIELLSQLTNLSFEDFMSKYNTNPLRPLLLFACARGATNSVEGLLEYGYNFNAKDSASNTALHVACRTQNIKLVDLFLQKGLNPLARNMHKETPLSISIKFPEICKRVLEHCPKPLEVIKEGDTAPPIGYVALAAFENSIESVKLLIDHGADINIPCVDGIDAICIACTYSNLELIDILVDAGLDLNKEITPKKAMMSIYPLCLAMVMKNNVLSNKLIERGASMELAAQWAIRNLNK